VITTSEIGQNDAHIESGAAFQRDDGSIVSFASQTYGSPQGDPPTQGPTGPTAIMLGDFGTLADIPENARLIVVADPQPGEDHVRIDRALVDTVLDLVAEGRIRVVTNGALLMVDDKTVVARDGESVVVAYKDAGFGPFAELPPDGAGEDAKVVLFQADGTTTAQLETFPADGHLQVECPDGTVDVQADPVAKKLTALLPAGWDTDIQVADD
jgi:hypothetical protein